MKILDKYWLVGYIGVLFLAGYLAVYYHMAFLVLPFAYVFGVAYLLSHCLAKRVKTNE